MLKSYRDLKVWQKSMLLVQDVYAQTKQYPKEEQFCLTNQMRRSAIRIPSNIAEGHGRNTDGEFAQFLGMASGSLSELETQIELSMRLGYMETDSNLPAQCDEIGRMLSALLRTVFSR